MLLDIALVVVGMDRRHVYKGYVAKNGKDILIIS